MGNAWNANKINHDTAAKGVEIEVNLPDGEGGKETWIFTVVYGGTGANKRVAVAREAITRRLKKKVGGVNEAELAREVMAEAILQGWSGIKGPDGNEFPFNKENAITLFKDFPRIFEVLTDKAMDPSVFGDMPTAQEIEDDSGN